MADRKIRTYCHKNLSVWSRLLQLAQAVLRRQLAKVEALAKSALALACQSGVLKRSLRRF